MIVFTIDGDAESGFRWTLWQESHTQIAVAGTTYASIAECVAAIKLLKQFASTAHVYDVSSGEERLLGS
jgi:uncharacterized protein YegP (UPF0339 family)